MGFRIPKRTATIIWDEGHDYHGAEAQVRLDVPMALTFQMQRYNDDDANREELLRRFGDAILISWNIEDDDGAALPATGEGMLQAPPAFVLDVLNHWIEATQAVPAPLVEESVYMPI